MSGLCMTGCSSDSDPKTVVYSVYIDKEGQISCEWKNGRVGIYVDDIVRVFIDKDPEIEIETVDLFFDGDNETIQECPYTFEKRMETQGMHTIVVKASRLTATSGNISIVSRTCMLAFNVNKR